MSGVCARCARRAWLLARLSVRLDFRARDLSRLWSLLELPDLELIEAIGGRRRTELHGAYLRWRPEPGQDLPENVEALCRHHGAFPRGLRESPLGPHALGVRGGTTRLSRILDEPVVAIVGSRRASDYGMETARDLARGLAASGVTVLGALAEGIPAAAHTGALEAGGATLTVMAGNLERCSPAWCTALYRRITSHGCAISETPASVRASHWGAAARMRTLALLARLVIVVEADERPWELACAQLAQTLDRPVGAVPGRVTSPTSRGANALLMSGARLVRSPQDALDLLYGVGVQSRLTAPHKLAPSLLRVLEEVGGGADTMAKLRARGGEPRATASALAELELQGLLVRGDGGRYMCSGALTAGNPQMDAGGAAK